jgi:toxin ParE1/3/4
LLDEIEKKEKTLEITPTIFPFVPDDYLARKRIKFLKIKNYMLFYIIDEDEETVTVIRFLYCRRDWKNILKYSIIE